MDEYLSDNIGQYLEELQQMHAVVTKYETALKNNQTPYLDSNELEDLFHFYLSIDKDGKAEDALDLFAKLHPSDDSINLLRCQYLFHQGKIEDGLKMVDAIDMQDNDLWHDLRLHALVCLKREEEAKKEGSTILYNAEDKVDAALDIASEFHQQDMYESALYFYEAGLLYDGEDMRLIKGAARCYGYLGRSEKAIEYSEKIIEKDAYDADAWLIKASAYMSMGDAAKAAETYGYALAIDDKSNYAWIAKVKAEILSEQYDRALQTVDEMVQHLPMLEPIGYCMKGDVYYIQEQYKEAHKVYKKGFTTSMFTPDSALKYLSCKLKLHRWKEVVSLGEDLLRAIPEEGDVYEMMADAYYHLKDMKQAAKVYARAIKAIPKDIHLMCRYATILLDMRETEKALKVLQKARKIDKESTEVNMLLAIYYFAEGDAEKYTDYLIDVAEVDMRCLDDFLIFYPREKEFIEGFKEAYLHVKEMSEDMLGNKAKR